MARQPRDSRIHFACPSGLRARLEAIAERKDVTLSTVCYEAAKEYANREEVKLGIAGQQAQQKESAKEPPERSVAKLNKAPPKPTDPNVDYYIPSPRGLH